MITYRVISISGGQIFDLYTERIDVLIRILCRPITDDGEEEDITIWRKTIDFHESRQLLIRLLRVKEIRALRQDRKIQSGRTDIVAGKARTFLTGLRHNGRRVLEILREKILLTDDPARRLVLAEGMGKSFMHMSGADSDSVKAPAMMHLRDRRHIHAALRIALEKYPIEW